MDYVSERKRKAAACMKSTIKRRALQDFSMLFELPTICQHSTPTIAQPPYIRIPLYDYQLRSLHRMREIEANPKIRDLGTFQDEFHCKGGLVADCVGMGKTAQLIGLMLCDLNDKKRSMFSNLVVTLSHLCQQWKDEVIKFAGDRLRVVVISNRSQHYRLTRDDIVSANVVILSLDYLTGFVYRALWHWHYVISKQMRKREVISWGGLSVMKEPQLRQTCVSDMLCDAAGPVRCPLCFSVCKDFDAFSKHLCKYSHRELERSVLEFVENGWLKREQEEQCDEHLPDHWVKEPSPMMQTFHSTHFRRIVFDECHEAIHLDNEAHMDLFSSLSADNVWCVTGTPFPMGDLSVYGIHRLLGIKLKLHISDTPFAINKPLAADHPFEKLKRKIYLKNTPESVGEEWEKITAGRLMYIDNTALLQFSDIEQGFYDEQARKIKTHDPYSPSFIPLRQLCCHPAANEEWAVRLQSIGLIGAASDDKTVSLEQLRKRMISHKKEQLTEMRSTITKASRKLAAAENSLHLVLQLQKFRDVTESTVTKLNWQEEVAGIDDQVEWRLIRDKHTTYVSSRAEVIKWMLSVGMSTCEQRDHFLDVTGKWAEETREKLRRLENEVEANQRDLNYFSGMIQELETEVKKKECLVCNDELKVASVTPCGHYYCTTCLQCWLHMHGTCPTCRKPCGTCQVVWIQLRLQGVTQSSRLVQQFGTKPAALVEFIKDTIATEPSDVCSRFIVFSQWHKMLVLVSKTLRANGIRSVFCAGRGTTKERAIHTFKTSEDIRVLMLSIENAAAGTNLTFANHVIIMEPAGQNSAHGVAMETQAIGRSVRLGQLRRVTVTRFVVEDTVEEKIHQLNMEARKQRGNSILQPSEVNGSTNDISIKSGSQTAASKLTSVNTDLDCSISEKASSSTSTPPPSSIPSHSDLTPVSTQTPQKENGPPSAATSNNQTSKDNLEQTENSAIQSLEMESSVGSDKHKAVTMQPTGHAQPVDSVLAPRRSDDIQSTPPIENNSLSDISLNTIHFASDADGDNRLLQEIAEPLDATCQVQYNELPICPICSKRIQLSELWFVNKHVDDCMRKMSS